MKKKINLETEAKLAQAKEMMDSEDVKPDVPYTNMTLTEFKAALLEGHQSGRALTLRHREEMPMSHNSKKDKRLGHHAPGTDYENCQMCKELVDTHNKIMKMQSDVFGITGIPYDNLMASIKITEGIQNLIKNETLQSIEEGK